ncbi:unnamed protein product [Prunus armeniaca]|uniref:MYND-type domain-containing protein n=1 Tax=Prunus armeniaca TaxID=36596 RepID=A0A6J5U6V9_PRUAR|nr:unnamed protein product [Prunus armeniaca]
MPSTGDLPQASLVHTEDPFSMIILKPCREAHCHYYLNELPANKVPCTSCSIPLYCSQKCRIRAGGKMSWDYPNNQRIHENLSADLELCLLIDRNYALSRTLFISIHAYFLSHTLFIRTTEFVAAGEPLELSCGPQVGQWDCEDRVKFLEDEYSFRCQCSGCLKVNFSDLVLNALYCVKPNCSGIVLQSSVVDCEKEKLKHLPNIITVGNMEPHLQAEEFINIDDIDRVAHHMQINRVFHINPGLCLKSCSYRDLESSSAAANKAWIRIRRELQPAREHCKASIEILEKLYNPNHIVIGYELVKLSSIQLSLGECAAVDSINRPCDIFSCYYGSHTYKIFPYLQFLKRREKQTSSLKHQQK